LDFPGQGHIRLIDQLVISSYVRGQHKCPD
jgi:hypothetical protein